MSPNTSGLESTVTVTFKKQGKGTLMTLVHSGLPDTNPGKGYEKEDGRVITMVHRGLTPEVECYSVCQPGWERHVTKSLYKLISEGTGTPQ